MSGATARGARVREARAEASAVPTRWRSALPHLDEPLPEDLPPEGAAAGSGVHINLPMELVRQSLQTREFWDIPQEVADAYRSFRPTPLWRARRFETAIGAKVPIWVKYEGGNVSGSHKLNTALAQAYYYKRAGVRELVTGTGAGQWGTALAAACAMFGLRCTVFMVGSSLAKKPYRGVLMRLLGAEVHASPSGLTDVAAADDGSRGNSLTLAIGEAVEYARAREGAAFCIGSGETYSILHQSVIGLECEEQLAAQDAEVGAVVGAVGAGSNFGGIALPFFASARSAGRRPPRLVAAESAASPKLSRGVYAYDKTDATGTGPREAMYTIGSEYRIPDSHSGGLRYHGAAKIVSALRHSGRVDAVAVGQVEALEAGRLFTLHEMVLPAPESGHALAVAAQLACRGDQEGTGRGVLVCLSGHGYLDLGAYQQLLAGELSDRDPDPAGLLAAMSALPLVGERAGGPVGAVAGAAAPIGGTR
jgi:tryptophan synthase beta chain